LPEIEQVGGALGVRLAGQREATELDLRAVADAEAPAVGIAGRVERERGSSSSAARRSSMS
jgi:hypothetical protein